MSKTNRMDVFMRTYNRKPGAGRVLQMQLPVPADRSLATMLTSAISAGANQGGAGRHYGGIFEIQTDGGIWSTTDGGKLTERHGNFKSWEQLESEEHANQ